MNQSAQDYAVDELCLFIENEEQLYRSQFIPIVKNVQRRKAKGTYDSAKAVKLFMYLVDNGARAYVKEFGGSVRHDFPKPVRELVAISIRDGVEAELAVGGEMFS